MELINFSGKTLVCFASENQEVSRMKAYPAFVVLVLATASDAYTCGGGGFTCGSPNNFVFPSMMRNMSPRQRAAYRRQQREFVDRALDALAKDLQRSGVDPGFIPKQKEMVDKTVEFFTDLGSINREDADNLRDITNKGLEIAQDVVTGSYSPAYDMEDGESEIEISMDLPGVAREDIDITFDDDILTVSGSRKFTKKDEIKSVPFKRAFTLDATTVDVDKISANLDSGVLQISIPKKPVEKPPIKRIDIQ